MANRKRPTGKPEQLVTSVTIVLQVPVEHDGKTYSELTLRRMKARDALLAEDTDDQGIATARLFASLASVPPEVILDLDMEDFVELGAQVAPLMGKRAQAMLEAAGLQSPGET